MYICIYVCVCVLVIIPAIYIYTYIYVLLHISPTTYLTLILGVFLTSRRPAAAFKSGRWTLFWTGFCKIGAHFVSPWTSGSVAASAFSAVSTAFWELGNTYRGISIW
jgi:uncharacterized protein (DUF2062 family)